MKKYLMVFALSVLIVPFAWGKGHEDCNLCHENAENEDYTIIVSPDTKTINSHTGRPFGVRDAICMSCHNDNIEVSNTHSVGVVPKNAVMPKVSLGFKGQETELTCEGCHDPHDEENYMYLRWGEASSEAGGLINFCRTCHPKQGGIEH